MRVQNIFGMWGQEKMMTYRLVATSTPGKPSDLQAKQDLFLCSLPRATSDHRIFPTWLLPKTFRNLILPVSNGPRAKRFLKAFHYFFHLYKANALISLCFKTSPRKAESGSNKLPSLSYILFFFLSTCLSLLCY